VNCLRKIRLRNLITAQGLEVKAGLLVVVIIENKVSIIRVPAIRPGPCPSAMIIEPVLVDAELGHEPVAPLTDLRHIGKAFMAVIDVQPVKRIVALQVITHSNATHKK
jgi:hypothetical protein